MLGTPLRRITPLRRLYILCVDPRRYRQFALTEWVHQGLRLQRQAQLPRLCFEDGQAWVRLPNRLELAYVADIPGDGLDAEAYYGNYAPALTRMLLDVLQDGAVMVDIGANIGWFSLHVAAMYANTRVYAFEPGDVALHYLCANVARNGLTSRVTVIPKAVADVTGTMQFTNDHVAHALNHLQPASTTRHDTVCVDTITLDDFVLENNIDRLDVIKCDVEGAEFLVLQGAKETLAQFHPTLFMEIDPFWLQRFAAAPRDIIALLQSYGYQYQVERYAGEENWLFTHRHAL